MKAIDKNNIEECLFDYFEGNLKEGEKNQLTDFLNRHPEFRADHEAWKKSYVVELPMVYPNADKLLMKPTFNKKIFWLLGAATVGVITALLLMFGNSSSEKQPSDSADLVNTDSSPVEKKIVQEQKTLDKTNETPEIYSSDKKEHAAFALNQPNTDKQKPKKEMPEKHIPQIAEQPSVILPVQSEKIIPEAEPQEKLLAETSADVPHPVITENSLPEKSVQIPETSTSQEQLHDSTTIPNQIQTVNTNTNNENDNDYYKDKRRKKFKWVIKVIPIKNIGL